MKYQRWVWSVSALFFVALVVLSVNLVSDQVFSQTKLNDSTNVRTGKKASVTWEQKRIPIKPYNSQIELSMPDLAADSDWIVGVAPTKKGEKQEMAVGLVSWESAGVSNRLNVQKIADISNYPTDSIETSQGRLSVVNPNDTDSLDKIDTSGKTLIIFMKVAPETKVSLMKDGKSLTDRTVDSGFAFQQNFPLAVKANTVSGLLTQLQANRLTQALTKIKPGGRNE